MSTYIADAHTHAFVPTRGGDWLCYADGIRRTSQPAREELRDPPPERPSYDPDDSDELVDSAFERAFLYDADELVAADGFVEIGSIRVDESDVRVRAFAGTLPEGYYSDRRDVIDETTGEIEDVPAGPLARPPDELTAARARRADPDTSHAAADSVNPHYAGAVRELIGSILDVRGPLTDEEIFAELERLDAGPISPSGARTRRSELVKVGRVEYAGYKRPLSSGREGRVWRRSE